MKTNYAHSPRRDSRLAKSLKDKTGSQFSLLQVARKFTRLKPLGDALVRNVAARACLNAK